MGEVDHLDDHGQGKPRPIRRFPRLAIRRIPRRTAEDIAYHRRLRLITELEKEAIEWVGRGREANIELGRRFIRLKDLVGHGHFREYYERKFGKPHQIAFRTAQAYMQLARKTDEAKNADSALFPLALDAHAVAVREATERHRATVARTNESRSEDATPDRETNGRKQAHERSSMCTCRLSIRMSEDQRARVFALLRSEHRAMVESLLTEFLIDLCSRYEIGGGPSEESGE